MTTEDQRLAPALEWYRKRDWTPLAFQLDAWRAYLDGCDGLIASPTGSGKTQAAAIGPMLERLCKSDRCESDGETEPDPIRVLWITPLRALAADTTRALTELARELAVPWSVEQRTGDTSSSVKARQKKRLPSVLVTTPESLALLLSWKQTHEQMQGLRAVVCDEWHELIGSKRGSMLELGLAHLRGLAPNLRICGLSATIGNLEVAGRVLVGANRSAPRLIRDHTPKQIDLETILPESIERYPWAGHLGTRLIRPVAQRILEHRSTLVFTNTRSQTEIWFRELMRTEPKLVGRIALHHGSLDRAKRERVEAMLRDGRLQGVVCTSSLDLGVDFEPVDQVVQIGSPKGVARMVQRAGRSGHQPGASSRIVCVPTNAFELVEFAAVRELIESGSIESRIPIENPLDILVQHLVTASMAGRGFKEENLREEVGSAWSFRTLSDEQWTWAMEFVIQGGAALGAYPEFSRIRKRQGRFGVSTPEIAKRHRMNIGTITSDDAVLVCYANGRTIGTIEESFISRLRSGDRFVFSGRVLEFTRLRNMRAFVRRSRSRRGAIPRWNGGKMPLSTHLSAKVREQLARPQVSGSAPELEAVAPILEAQSRDSQLPDEGTTLIEFTKVRDRHHVFLFPFGGRLANEGIGAVASLRLSRLRPRSVVAVANDYGIKLASDLPFEQDPDTWRSVLDTGSLVEDLMEASNATEFARRGFRSIARIAGLVQQGYPGSHRAGGQLQASSEMFFEVFQEYDPENMLLEQASREVLENQLELVRVKNCLGRVSDGALALRTTKRVSPLAFPLYAESIRASTVTSEQWSDRVRKLARANEEVLSG